MTKTTFENHVVRKRQSYNTARWERMYEVHENGVLWDFTGAEMWLRECCDVYERAPVFPAITNRELYGYTDHKGVVHEPFRLPHMIDGKQLVIDGVPQEITISDREVRPGAVWMTKRMMLGVWSDFFNIYPDRFGYLEARVEFDEQLRKRGGRPKTHYQREYYHPGETRHRLQHKKGALFTPHDSAVLKKLGIPEYFEEQFAHHRRTSSGEKTSLGRLPKTKGEFMIHPDVLDNINKPHIWDLFLERRENFDIMGRAPKPNRRMWEWRDLLVTLEHYPVFDKEVIARISADPEYWGKPTSAATIDNHIAKWLEEDSIERVRAGLYRPKRNAWHDYNPFGDVYLVDWFHEFLRRQAARERLFPGSPFDLDTIREDIDKFHPEWKQFYGTSPGEQAVRVRLNKETGTMTGAPEEGYWIRKRGRDRFLTKDCLDVFAPAGIDYLEDAQYRTKVADAQLRKNRGV